MALTQKVDWEIVNKCKKNGSGTIVKWWKTSDIIHSKEKWPVRLKNVYANLIADNVEIGKRNLLTLYYHLFFIYSYYSKFLDYIHPVFIKD
jgi:hypothetical protein